MDFTGVLVRRRLVSLVALVPLLLTGCGGDGATSGFLPTQTVAPSGVSIASTQTGPSGLFRFDSPRVIGTVDLNGASSAQVRLLPAGSGYLIEARLDNGVVLQANADLAAADRLALNGITGGIDPNAKRSWVWVTPLSTLIAAYRQAHPDAGQEGQSLQKVKSYLAMAPRDSVNRIFSSVATSQFSPRVFLQSAGAQELPAFSASLVSEIDAGRVHLFREPANQQLLKSLFNLPLFVNNPTFKGFAQNIWGGGMTWSLASKGLGIGLGKLLGVMGLHSSTYKQLQQIQNQLTAMTEQLTQMQTQLANIQNQAALDTLNNDLSPALNTISGYTNQQLSAMTAAQPPNSFYVPFSTDDSFQTNSNFQAALAGANQNNARSATITVLADSLGIGTSTSKGNLVTGYIQRLAQLYGSGVNSYSDYANGVNAPLYYDFRSDVAVTQTLTNVTGAYQVEAMLGANMLSESASKALSSNTQSPVADLASAQVDLNGYKKPQVVGGGLDTNSVLTQNGLAALSKRLIQQQPLAYIGGESPLANLWWGVNDAEDVVGTPGSGHINGTVWSALGYELTGSGNTPPGNSPMGITDVSYYSVSGWEQWYLPSKSEVQQLFDRAKSIARNSTNPPSGKNEVAFGLHQMGLISDKGYQHALNDSGYVEIYYDLEVGSGGQEGFHLQVLRSDGTSYDNGLTTEKDALGVPSILFKPQDGHLAAVLLVRPLPGLPLGADSTYLAGQATTTAPTSVQQSQSAQKLGSGLRFWNSDLALAGGLVPDEIVIQQDPANPYQLRAYGLWTVGLQNPPKAYSGDYFLYPNAFASNYLIYTELTDLVEWLSSDTSSVEVSNYPPPGVTMIGANLTGLSGTVSVENVTGTQNGGILQISGGQLLQASALSGLLSGGNSLNLPTFQGDITQGQSPPNPVPVEGGQLTGGDLTVTSTNTLLNPADGSQAGFVTNGTVSGASLQGALIPISLDSGNAGLMNVHAVNPVNVTASWMYSPSVANGTTNSVGSVPSFIPPAPGAAAFPYVGETPLALTPPPALSGIASLVLSPNYTTVIGNTTVGGGQIPFFLTAINYDGTYTSMETSANATFQPFLLTDGQTAKSAPNLFFKNPANGGNQGTQNILSIPPGFTGYVAIKASLNGRSTYAFMNLSF